MARTAVPIDREELEAAIQMVEDTGPLPSLSALYSAVAHVMGDDISPQIIKARVTEWDISIKTKPGRKQSTNVARTVTGERSTATRLSRKLHTIYTPSGKCPYRLPASDYDSVVTWASKVREHGLADKWNGVYYLVEALIYYSRQADFGFAPKELDDIASHLLEWNESQAQSF